VTILSRLSPGFASRVKHFGAVSNAKIFKRHHYPLMAEVAATGGAKRWWWLSFADGNLPKGTQFLGAAVVEACGMAGAAFEAHRLGINPGGEVLGIEIPDKGVPPESHRNRLLSREEVEAM
jgi:hypothetical protein